MKIKSSIYRLTKSRVFCERPITKSCHFMGGEGGGGGVLGERLRDGKEREFEFIFILQRLQIRQDASFHLAVNTEL